MKVNIVDLFNPTLFSKIFDHADIRGPRVDVLQAELSPKQMEEVLAGYAYHIIIDSEVDKQYRVGFCGADADDNCLYVTQPIDSSSYNESRPAVTSLLTLISDYRDLLKGEQHQSRQRLALKYVEGVIKAHGGKIYHRLRKRTEIAAACRSFRANLNLIDPDPRKRLFQTTIRKEIFSDLLHHVAYGEVEEAQQILKHFPEMLLSEWKGNVEDHSQHKIYQAVTAFQMAMRTGCKAMCKMILNIANQTAPKDELDAYCKDLFTQVPENPVENLRLPYVLDGLDAAGLRVIEAGDAVRFPLEMLFRRDDQYDRHAYYLLIDRDEAGTIINPRLVFRSEDNSYRKYSLAEYDTHEAVRTFHAFVCKPANIAYFQRGNIPRFQTEVSYPHKVIHNREVKALARAAIETLGGVTRLNKYTTFKDDCEHLERAFHYHVELWQQLRINIDDKLSQEHWCVIVGAMQRLMPKSFWEYYVDNQFSKISDVKTKDFEFIPSRDLFFHDGEGVLPFSENFSDIYSVCRNAHAEDCIAPLLPSFLSSFVSNAHTTCQDLYLDLQRSLTTSLDSAP